MPKGHSIDWETWDEFLGTDYDSQIAKSIGCTRHAVTRRRNVLGIPRYQFVDWKEVAELRRRGFSHGDVAHILGCARSTVHNAENGGRGRRR